MLPSAQSRSDSISGKKHETVVGVSNASHGRSPSGTERVFAPAAGACPAPSEQVGVFGRVRVWTV